MKKITTLFKKNPDNLALVTTELDPANAWVLEHGIPTRKFDGTSCAIIDGKLYKRYDAKQGRPAPENGIPCQEKDPITGHWPHWVPVTPNDKWHNLAFNLLNLAIDGTYELVGEKVQSNPEKITGHKLIPHGKEVLPVDDFTYEGLKKFLSENDIEGIVFHDKTGQGRMCKIRKSDFGIKR